MEEIEDAQEVEIKEDSKNLQEKNLQEKNLPEKNQEKENQEKENKEELYQWIWGEKLGQTVKLSGEADDEFIYFKDGGRISKEFFSKALRKVNPGEEIPDVTESKKLDDDILNSTNLNAINKKAAAEKANIPTKPEKSALRKMLEKQSKKNLYDMSIDLQINIPKKDIFNVILESFDEDDDENPFDTLMEMVLDSIDYKGLRDKLENDLKTKLANYYKLK
jgi:hypothetical protein